VGIATGLVWIAMAAIFRISSLAGLAAALSAPAMLMLMRRETPANLILLIATAVLIVLRHRENIVRIAKGAEPRIGAGKTPPAQ
jgi:glycerol-3-phosphate acyltransferase PlsY